MKWKSFEIALHRWPEWKISITSGRKQLGAGAPPPGLEAMRGAAQWALAGLGFPECAMMELYWLCCVFSDYDASESGYYKFDLLVLPDWFPLPFGFKHNPDLDFEGLRIRPPELWTDADVKFWGRRSPLARMLPKDRIEEYLAKWFPDPEIIMVLPADHSVRKRVRPGRPDTDTPSGETMVG